MDMSDLIIPEQLTHTTPIVTCIIEGILDDEDMRAFALGTTVGGAELASSIVEPDDPSDLKKLRAKHHSVARMVASGGLSQSMVAAISGYTESYVSILLNSPAMQELVEMYRIQSGAAAAVIAERLKTVGTKALERLETRIDEDQLNAQELLAAAKLGFDRSGHGPTSTQHIVAEDHFIDHARIAELNAEALRGSDRYIVPVHEVRKALNPPEPPAQEE